MLPTLRHGLVAAIVPAFLVVSGQVALAQVQPGHSVGLKISEIARSLEDNGYEIQEIEVKPDRVEVEVVIEGEKLEIKVDPQSGLVTRVEHD
ncbi:PepSY domain-containing protein [Roseibium sp.]|uniref:PepSY domain-containing protein n=1 Tax=Roseibium sp. TaxID=1936156 RepID=UPI003BB000F7